jgi:hypothetical protein
MSMFLGGPNSWRNFMQAFNFLGIPFLFGVALVVGGVVLIVSGRRDRY